MQFFEVNLPFYKSQINIQSIFNAPIKDNKKSKITPPFSKKNHTSSINMRQPTTATSRP